MIHIDLVDMHGTAPYLNQDKKVEVTKLTFHTTSLALRWWKALQQVTHLTEENAEGVIKATTDEYVGVELELMTQSGDYTSWVLCIEGRETS